MTLVLPRSDISEKLYTAEDLLALPSDARFELVEGILSPMSPTSAGHGAGTMRLSAYLTIFVIDNDLGETFAAETGFLLSRNPDVVLAPDFAYVSKSGAGVLNGPGYLSIAPDLVLETRSPGDRPSKVAEKIRRWLSYGVLAVIDADPQRQTLTVHQPNTAPVTVGKDETLTLTDLLPGFELPLSRIF
jgi:Uma2 family endonuclease